MVQMLSSAQALSVQQQTSTDEDILEFNCTLRTAIFDAYSGIFNGLSKEKVAALLPHSAQVPLPAAQILPLVFLEPLFVILSLLSNFSGVSWCCGSVLRVHERM